MHRQMIPAYKCAIPICEFEKNPWDAGGIDFHIYGAATMRNEIFHSLIRICGVFWHIIGIYTLLRIQIEEEKRILCTYSASMKQPPTY